MNRVRYLAGMAMHSSQDHRPTHAKLDDGPVYTMVRAYHYIYPAACECACLPVEVAAHKVVNDRSVLAQQMTIVVLKCQLPKESFFHGQLWCSFPVERQIVGVDHLSPLVLSKLHFVKGT